MGFDMTMLWATAYDKETGKPRQTTPPDVPEPYRKFLSVNGWFYANFTPHDTNESYMSASALYDNYLPEWDEIDWNNLLNTYDEENRADYKEEYEEWRTAMKWFADNGFDAVWWW